MTPETRRLIQATAVVLIYLGFCGAVAWRRRRGRVADAMLLPASGDDGVPLLVAYASQTGFAEEIARRSAEALQGAVPVRLARLDALDAATLAATRRAVFVIATTGEGDAPDNAARFVRKVMGETAGLSGLNYGLLALGDQGYARYCAFGRQLDTWLQAQGATPLFDRVEVDDGDGGALRHWQYHLGRLAGTEVPDWAPAQFLPWRLVERRLLNSGSVGGGAFHLALEPMEGQPEWSAGDIAEVGPRNSPEAVTRILAQLGLKASADVADGTLGEALAARLLPVELETLAGLPPQLLLDQLTPIPHREYSIASIASAGRVELLVRQMSAPDGRLGLGSGWLTEHAPLGGPIALRIRTNRSFHPPDEDRPLILIGNGTGLAGLRAHLKARQAMHRSRNWLVFGERTREHDFLHRTEIEAWAAEGHIERLDLAFSRDHPARIYVQDCLRAAGGELRNWVAAGAAIYVCGSLEGMSAGVHAALADELGSTTMERLAEEGLYRRDVY
ncbi:MAG: Flavodoxin/nitric oxide synthase [Rubritepida sp.]|nr:Flavodoxin/nitric oxide synthase [Rubritepida sp.]